MPDLRHAFQPLEPRVLLSTTRFAAIGNFGVNTQAEADVANLVHSWDPEFVITLGDNNYPHGSSKTIDANIGQYYQRYISPYKGAYGPGSPDGVNRFFPSLGNHDWETRSGTPSLPTPYLNYFTLPNNERYYTYTRGPIQFFVLDSDSKEPDGVTASSIQGDWLKNQLAASAAPWKVVYFHHPPYSSAGDTSTDMRWPFAQWGADVVLNGHRHVYERVVREDNFPYFTNGIGGAPFSNFGTNPTNGSQLRHNTEHGAMLIEADDDVLTLRAITIHGKTIDRYSLYNIPAPSAPPGSLSATTSSSSKIKLAWTDYSSNESGFRIERSTDGINFTRVNTVGANVRSYSDGALAAGVTYYYRIRSFNEFGDSAPTNVAAATTTPIESILPAGSTWRYLDDGADPGVAWRDPAFDDSLWKSGPAELGFGDGDERTVTSRGTSTTRVVTTYFRRAFTVPDPAAFSALTLRLKRDDGAIVYLNGVEVVRSNMPAGPVISSTLASSGIGGTAETAWNDTLLSPSLLRAGANVFAVEIHQNDPSSSDLSFDFELTATPAPTTPAAVPVAISMIAAREVSSLPSLFSLQLLHPWNPVNSDSPLI